MNKIEEYKREKDGLDILPEVPRYAAEGWEAITDGDKERLKWAGVFSQADARNFMMRVRGRTASPARRSSVRSRNQREFGKGFCDITTRQQIRSGGLKLKMCPRSGGGSTGSGWSHCRPAWTTSVT
jgi:ferredoxin-nitrite reductase